MIKFNLNKIKRLNLTSNQVRLISTSTIRLKDGVDNNKLNPYSRFRDALDSTSTTSTSPSAAYNNTTSNNNKIINKPRTTLKRQTLSNAEAATFASLLEGILPDLTSNTSTNSNTLGPFGSFLNDSIASSTNSSNSNKNSNTAADKISKALIKSISGTRIMWERRAKTLLNSEEELKLDKMRELMLNFRTDLDLLNWSIENVFGFSSSSSTSTSTSTSAMRSTPSTTSTTSNTSGLWRDLRTLPLYDFNSIDSSNTTSTSLKVGPSSPLYPELLVILFLLLRDNHKSPNTALYIFKLASSTAQSYVLGCTTTLYNEVLRTNWLEGGGNIENVSVILEEMISGGIKIDDLTKSIIFQIGEAIRIDENRAERRAIELLASENSSSSINLVEEVQREISQENLDKFRYFTPSQIRSWAKMERIVQESDEELTRKKLLKDEEKSLIYEAKRSRVERNEIREAKFNSPDMFFSPTISKYNDDRDNGDMRNDRDEDDYGFSEDNNRGGERMSMSDRRRERSEDGTSRNLNREDRLGYMSSSLSSARRSSSSSTFRGGIREAEDENDDQIDSSWKNFPEEVFPRRSPPTSSSSSHSSSSSPFSSSSRSREYSTSSRSGAYSASYPPSSPASSSSSNNRKNSTPTQRTTNLDLSTNDLYDLSEEDNYTLPLVRESRIRSEDQKEDRYAKMIDGVIVLPKRPSFANPFKIRRKNLTKAEKSRHDSKHPMLAWKKKAT